MQMGNLDFKKYHKDSNSILDFDKLYDKKGRKKSWSEK